MAAAKAPTKAAHKQKIMKPVKSSTFSELVENAKLAYQIFKPRSDYRGGKKKQEWLIGAIRPMRNSM